MNDLISKSENFKQEYCCTIVRIGQVQPIESSDFLGQVMVEGRTIVVRKDQVKEGNVMFYVSNECQVNGDFLSINSFYEDKAMNANPEQKGYINKYGRIRMVKLRGVLSMGILFTKENFVKWCPKMDELNVEKHVGEDFDAVAGEIFVKAYVPMRKENTHHTGTGKRKTEPKFDRLIPGEFLFHYETQQLNREIGRLNPTDVVSISCKMHGTSLVIGNIRTLKPRWGGLYARCFTHLPKLLQFTKMEYDVVYSSRTVVKNKYYNKKVHPGYYETDVWGEYYALIAKYIPEGYTLYGEILGYVGGLSQMIQKGYDYGCKPGENCLMIYRVSIDKDGRKRELNIPDVQEFSDNLVKRMQADGNKGAVRIIPLPILYHGTLSELYPSLNTTQQWNENLLEAMKHDTEHFGMEQDEPLCRNKVPREGICLRIDNDPVNECFKLKTLRFLGKEAELMDKGEVDIEMQDGYSESDAN